MPAPFPIWIRYSLLALTLIPCWIIAHKFDIDLVNLHYVAAVSHIDLTRVYAQNGNLGRFFYGPFCLVLVSILGFFSYTVVKYLWIALQTAAYALFWWSLYRLYPWLTNPTYGLAWIFIWILTINPIHNNFQSNNIQLMLAAVLFLAESWSRDFSWRRQMWAGVFVVAATAVKVFPGLIVLYYLMTKPRDVRRGIYLGTAISLLAPFVVYGVSGGTLLYRGFFENLTTYKAQNSLVQTEDILCLPSLLERFGVPGLPSKMILIGVLAAFFISVIRCRKVLLSTGLTQSRYWAMAMALCVFLNPSTRPHYYVFYIPAYCAVVERTLLERWRWSFGQVALLVSVILVAFTQEGVVGRAWNDRLEMWSIPTYGMLILMGMLVLLIVRERQTV
jgi:hypothetical protein